MVKCRRKVCLSVVKIGFIFYIFVFLLQFTKNYYRLPNGGVIDDVRINDGVNVRGYHYSRLPTLGINKLKPEINSRSTISAPSDVHFKKFLAPALLIVVCSHPSHVQHRLTIRNTWGYNLSEEVGVMFVVGRDKKGAWGSVVDRENVLHQDLIQVNTVEDYRNLTRKMIAGLNVIINDFSSAQYVLKTDDDAFINVPYVLEEITNNRYFLSESRIMGALCINATVIRDPRDVWSVPSKTFPNKTFPPYLAGGAYLFRTTTLIKLIKFADHASPYLHLEDVYITGILAQSAGIKHISHPGFSFWNSKKASACDIVNRRRISSVNMSDKQIKILYKQIHKYYVKGC
ncbi:beta-1,3-galactosyltransferase 1 [Patella vulgata]|uniref:beta-1,3-galactosyltransferase 1 n=1 Tax=Patella vulgata TaxID=6465 RepID=UPI0024A80CDC|nr:beta-1,3-galactosyltransferase 1 [Patella vulgata]